MRRIHKYMIEKVPNPTRLPPGSEIVSFRRVSDRFVIWALHTEEAITADDWEDRLLIVRGTGHEIPDDLEYISTHHTTANKTSPKMFVWHLFERME